MRTDKKKKKLKLDSRFFARLLVVLLTVSMLAGAFYYVIIFSHIDAMAVEPSPDPVNPTMRIAIFYGEKIAVDVKLTSEKGFRIGYTGGDKNFTDITTLSNTALFVARHVNLYYNGTRYVHATSSSGTTVGSYHICIESDDNYSEDIALIKEVFPEYNVFPGNIDQQYYVLIGQFDTEEAAVKAFDLIKETLAPIEEEQTTTVTENESSNVEQTDSDSTASNANTTGSNGENDTTSTSEQSSNNTVTDAPEGSTSDDVAEPEPGLLPADLTEDILSGSVYAARDDSVVLIDPSNHNIVWAFAHDNASEKRILAIGPCDPGYEHYYMLCYHGNSSSARKYKGFFECAPASSGSFKGIRAINLVKLEDYIVGVTCAEISTTWPLETLKAFIIAVRNYSLRSMNKHSGITADLCNEAHCQVFNGFAIVNDRVWRAARETADIIAVSSTGNMCGTYYSSSTGGCTANCTDVWGSSLATYPYLKAVATPWEKYTTYNKGQRITTATGTELYNLLNGNKNYKDKLTGPVTEIKITKTGNNTTYVTQIQFYDAAGHVVTVDRADKIKSLLSNYIYSSNFVVVKSGEDAVRTNYTMLGFGGVSNNTAPGVSILGNPDKYKVLGRQLFSVVTSNGKKTFYDSEEISVITSEGVKKLNMTSELDSQYYPTVIGVNGSVLPDVLNLSPIVTSETISTTYKANSFTFISRGWGHGVGMSQWGIYEMGMLGYDYQTILKAYYSGISLVRYYDHIN